MLGSMDKSQFNPETNYNHFYENHKFEPFPIPFDCHEVLPRASWTLDIANEIEAKSMLDVCCLDGFVALTLAKHCPTLEFIRGVDLSEPGIKRAMELAGNLDERDIIFIQDSVENYLLNTRDLFDIITMFEAVEHFTDVTAVMEMAKRRLAPGGRVLISTPDAEGFYGIGNDDACHLRYMSHLTEKEMRARDIVEVWEGRPILSLPDFVEGLGGTVVDNAVWNDLCHLSATFD